MSNEILVNVTPSESRVALVENGLLQELHLERMGDISYVGNIYMGRVERVLPGMQAAFVDIGLSRTAFLHAGEIARSRPELESDALDEHGEPQIPPIGEMIREGQSLPVQVVKDPMGSKGARLTTQLSLPSRYLVYLPGSSSIGVSLRIENEVERARLRDLVGEILEEHGQAGNGLILRTNAEGVGATELKRDLDYLRRLWSGVAKKLENGCEPGTCIYEDLSLPLRALRDLMHAGIERVRFDAAETYAHARSFSDTFIGEWSDRLESFSGPGPLFDLYGVEDEISRALRRNVSLKSGGHLTIDQTEAMTTIDVNTGGYVGTRNFAETVYKTNMEAAQALARQLRLRNLGGIIIIDFIDMEDSEHQRQVLRVLEKSLERDHAKNKLTGVTELGLVQLTRKRTRESLEQTLCEPCPTCQGRGTLKTPETVCYEIFREILREERAYSPDTYMVLASQEVVDRLLDEESAAVADLEIFIGKTIRFQVEGHYSQEQYDIVLM